MSHFICLFMTCNWVEAEDLMTLFNRKPVEPTSPGLCFLSGLVVFKLCLFFNHSAVTILFSIFQGDLSY